MPYRKVAGYGPSLEEWSQPVPTRSASHRKNWKPDKMWKVQANRAKFYLQLLYALSLKGTGTSHPAKKNYESLNIHVQSCTSNLYQEPARYAHSDIRPSSTNCSLILRSICLTVSLSGCSTMSTPLRVTWTWVERLQQTENAALSDILLLIGCGGMLQANLSCKFLAAGEHH